MASPPIPKYAHTRLIAFGFACTWNETPPEREQSQVLSARPGPKVVYSFSSDLRFWPSEKVAMPDDLSLELVNDDVKSFWKHVQFIEIPTNSPVRVIAWILPTTVKGWQAMAKDCHFKDSLVSFIDSSEFARLIPALRPVMLPLYKGHPCSKTVGYLDRRSDRWPGVLVQAFGNRNLVPCQCCQRRFAHSVHHTVHAASNKIFHNRVLWPFIECVSLRLDASLGIDLVGLCCGNCRFQLENHCVFSNTRVDNVISNPYVFPLLARPVSEVGRRPEAAGTYSIQSGTSLLPEPVKPPPRTCLHFFFERYQGLAFFLRVGGDARPGDNTEALAEVMAREWLVAKPEEMARRAARDEKKKKKASGKAKVGGSQRDKEVIEVPDSDDDVWA